MRFDFDGYEAELSSASNWYIPGTGASFGLTLGWGVDFGPVFSVGIAGQGSTAWIMVRNRAYPTAEALSFGGRRLERWRRYYWLEVVTGGLTVSASAGFGATGDASTSVESATFDDPSGGLGVVHRNANAPQGEEQERGDPTGFLGAALQDGLSGSISLISGRSAGAFTLALGCIIRDRNGALAVATLAQLNDLARTHVGIDHLLFKYAAAYWGVGSSVEPGLGISIGVSLDVAWVKRLHMFMVHEPAREPTGVPIYTYTRGVRDDGTVGNPYQDTRLVEAIGPSQRWDADILDDYDEAVALQEEVRAVRGRWAKLHEGLLPQGSPDLRLGLIRRERNALVNLRDKIAGRRRQLIFQPLHEEWNLQPTNATPSRRPINEDIRILTEALGE